MLGLLHDLGKYSQEFQDYLKSASGLIDQDADDFVDARRARGRIDHSTAGAQRIWRMLSRGGSPESSCVAEILSLCIASHHSGLIDCITPDGDDHFTRRINKAEKLAHLDEAWSRVDARVSSRLSQLLSGTSLVARMVAICRSITQREQLAGGSPPIAQGKLGLLVRFLFSALIDADRTDTADFECPGTGRLRHHGRYVPWAELIGRLEAHLASLANSQRIDRLRAEVAEQCRLAADRLPGIFTLTVPTGGGKTLASLRFALHHARRHQLDRVIHVVPFTTIIDQNADVVRSILEPATEGVERGRIVLEHHASLTPANETWQTKTLAENWDAPVVYTTSVQLLEALFGAGTRGARRMHQLANSVIVFDEAQTVPVRCIHLFNNAINFLVEHCGSSVVLCTATQPLLNTVDAQKGAARFAPADEIIPDVPQLFAALQRAQVRYRHQPGGWTDSDVATLAAEEIAAAGSCLVIVNTTKAARTLYQQAGQTPIGCRLHHLSARMCPAHRRKILAEIRQRLGDGAPTLCISTQLIEAGVDVDFAAVIRYVAGLDSIAQAAGRCNRNGRRTVGRVHVLNPADEHIDRLTDIRQGRDVAQRILSEFAANPGAFDGDLLAPKAMNRYFADYFARRCREMDYPLSPGEAGRDDSLLNLLAENRLAVQEYKRQTHSAPPMALRQAFMTAARAFRAIDAPTHGIIVPYGAEGRELVADLCSASRPDLQHDLLRQAQQFSVNVFSRQFDDLQEMGAVCEIGAGVGERGLGIFHLRAEYYSEEFGWSDTPVLPMETLYV